MAMYEKYNTRDLTYSRWHRTLEAELTWIDLDCVEYCRQCREPLLLIELAQDVGQKFKNTSVLRKLASKAKIPGWLVFWKKSLDGSIEQFRVQGVSPIFSNERRMKPDEYGTLLLMLRDSHVCEKGGSYHGTEKSSSSF